MIFSKKQLKKDAKGSLALVIFCLLLFGIRYTDDWAGYYHFFNNPEASPDLLFKYLSVFYKSIGLSYIDLFQLHILIIGFCISYFITRFSPYPLIVLFCVILIKFIPIVNQIRFYSAFGIFLMSIYSLIVSKRRRMAIFLMFLSIISHLAISPLFILFLIYPKLKNYTLKKISKILVLTSVLMFVIFQVMNTIVTGHFEYYLQGNSISSVIGGLYLILPIVLGYFFIFKYYKILCNKIPELLDDIKFKFLFILSVYTAPLLLIGLISQIVVHRYISIFSMVWLIYLIYPLSLDSHNKRNIIFSFLGFLFYLIALVYLVPIVVFGESEFVIKAFLTIESMESI